MTPGQVARLRYVEAGGSTMEIDAEADAAWSDAWDAACRKDVAEGRRYDRDRYAEAATVARAQVYRKAMKP